MELQPIRLALKEKKMTYEELSKKSNIPYCGKIIAQYYNVVNIFFEKVFTAKLPASGTALARR